MTKERELLRKIIRNMQYLHYSCNVKLRDEIIELLAQPEQTEQEPVAWMYEEATSFNKDRVTIQQKIKDLENQIEALKAQNLTNLNWNDAPIICELNGYRWHLGPEADEEMNWEDAKVWCELVGGELPPREVLLMCYLNEDIKPLFKTSWYWSSAEFNATYAWRQDFLNGCQGTSIKNDNNSVRAVKKVKI